MIEVTSAGGVSPTPPPDDAARGLIQWATTALSQSTDKARDLAAVGEYLGEHGTGSPLVFTPDEIRETVAGVTQWICNQSETDDAKAADLTCLVQGLATSKPQLSDTQMDGILHSIAENVPTDSKSEISYQLFQTSSNMMEGSGDPEVAIALQNLSDYLNS
jgi:hypothetical protein